MGIDLRRFSPYLDLLHNDRMDIYSTVESEDEDGAFSNVHPAQPQQKDVPCRISFSSKDTADMESPYEKVKLNPTIFCGRDVNVSAGDKVVVRRCHSDGTVYATYEGVLALTGKPNTWETHKEFELTMEGDA